MTLGFPLGLLALAAIPALVAAYFLRRKQPPRVVSALFLWRTPDQRAQAGPRFQRFSRELSLLLESLAVLCAALFLADARCGNQAPQRHVVVVVDGSLSMTARTGGQSAADRAKDEVVQLLKAERATAATLVESGVKPNVLAGPQADVDRARAALEAWRPAQPAHDVGAALLLARELASNADQRVVFITDGPLPERLQLPRRVEVRSVGRRADNVALVSAQRHDERGVARLTVRVANFGREATKVPVRFEAAEANATQSQQVTLEPGGSAVLRVGLKTAGPVHVALPEDALVEDGDVTLLPSPLSDVSVGLVDGLDGAALAALKRFFSIAPGLKVERPAQLTFGPPASQAQVRLGAKPPLKSFVGPFFAQKGNPLLDDVQLGGVVWTAGENPPGRVLMSAGGVVLLSQEADGTVHLNVDLTRSNLQRTPAWPILVSNVVRQARLGVPGLPRRHLMLGDEVPVVTTPGAAWRLEGPDGEERPVLASGAVTLPPVSRPGLWRLLKDGDVFDTLAVLPLDPRESDLSTRGPYEVKAEAGVGLASLATALPRPVWPLGVLLLLLLLDFFLTARGRHA